MQLLKVLLHSILVPCKLDFLTGPQGIPINMPDNLINIIFELLHDLGIVEERRSQST